MKCSADDQGRADLPRTIGHLFTELFLSPSLFFFTLKTLRQPLNDFPFAVLFSRPGCFSPTQRQQPKDVITSGSDSRRDADQPLVKWLRTLRNRVSSQNCHFGSFLRQVYRPSIRVLEGGEDGGYSPAHVQLVARVFKLKRQTESMKSDIILTFTQ